MSDKNSQFDSFSDLNVGDFPEATADKSGLYALSLAEIEERALKQAKMQKLGNDLMEVTGSVLSDLKGEIEPAKIRLLLSVFNHEVSTILVTNDVSEKCNLVLLLEGVRQEFETVITDGYRFPEKAVKSKLRVLTRVLGDLAASLITLRAEGDFEGFEEYIPNIVGISEAGAEDIGNLQMAMVTASTKEEVIAVLNQIEGGIPDIAALRAEKLAKFANGERSIGQFQYEKESWAAAKKAVHSFKPAAKVAEPEAAE